MMRILLRYRLLKLQFFFLQDLKKKKERGIFAFGPVLAKMDRNLNRDGTRGFSFLFAYWYEKFGQNIMKLITMGQTCNPHYN